MAKYFCALHVTHTYEGCVEAASVKEAAAIITAGDPASLEFDCTDASFEVGDIEYVGESEITVIADSDLNTLYSSKADALTAVEVAFPSVKKVRKVVDTTKFTKYQFDFVLALHGQFHQDLLEAKTVKELTGFFNDLFSLNKSTTSYANIWNGRTKRGSLPVGEADFLNAMVTFKGEDYGS